LTYGGSVYESYETIVQRIQNLFGKKVDKVLESNLARQGRASRAAIYYYKDNPSPSKYIYRVSWDITEYGVGVAIIRNLSVFVDVKVLVGAVLHYYETQGNEKLLVSLFYKIYFVRSYLIGEEDL
jgi:hypothetical protein